MDTLQLPEHAPFVIFAVVFLHVAALHVSGSNNPLGIDVKTPKDTVPFHPYYTAKDGFGLTLFLIFYAAIIFWAPNALGDPDNYVLANPLATPPDIVPSLMFVVIGLPVSAQLLAASPL